MNSHLEDPPRPRSAPPGASPLDSIHLRLIGGGFIAVDPDTRLRTLLDSIFDPFDDEAREVNAALKLGAQLGDLLGHMMYRKRAFDVCLSRSIRLRVEEASEVLGRACQVWDCDSDEDPSGEFCRFRFAPLPPRPPR